MAFVNELFERLSNSTSANDVREALASLNSIQDPIQRKKAAQDTIQLIHSYGQELIDRGQFKNAAYQFYSGSQVIKSFLNDTQLENQWLTSSALALAQASQEHISWNDILGGAACMTISSLLRIITGDWDVDAHLNQFIKANDFSENQIASACLYIPYNLANAITINNPNPELLQQASDFADQYLLNTKPAVMFVDAIRRVIEITRQILRESTRFPTIKAVFTFGNDIIFGEEFSFSVNMQNVGEGEATSVTAKIDIPENISILHGQNQISIDTLKSKSQSNIEFKLLCPVGEGEKEILVQIPVSVEYLDILGNKNSLSIGNAIFPIRSEKKGLKLIKKLDELKTVLDETLSPLKSSPNNDVQRITTGLFSIISKEYHSSMDCINNGEFSSANLGISNLRNLHEFIDPLTVFLVKLQEDSTHLINSMKSIKENSKELIESIDSLSKKFQS
ncbi:MAG: hypothetical protein ACXABI_08835 [Candidatus Hodarchaeales archaeon]|jgi:hypothetical protein